MTQAPVFNLNASNITFTDEEVQAELSRGPGNYFDGPGNHDLTVTAAGFHKNRETGEITCKGDPTWLNVKLTFTAADGKSVDHWLQVPTAKQGFGAKNTLLLYGKFMSFMIGIGESITNAKLQGMLEKYFTDPAKLIGRKVNVDLGYEGPYVEQVPDSPEYRIIVKGAPLKEDGVEVRQPSRGAAIQYAKSQGLQPSFLRILKFTPGKVAKPLKAAASDW